MKAGIITFHFVNNFGGALQTYALKSFVEEELGVETGVIDYRNAFIRFTDFVRLFPVSSSPLEIISGFMTFGARLGRLRRFRQFAAGHMRLTVGYATHTALYRDSPSFDRYICGSDQIWNPVVTGGTDRAYYLDFVDDPEKKLSYAASFGSLPLRDSDAEKARKYISGIGRVSVREEEAADYVERLTGSRPLRMIDPVLLLDKASWNKIAAKVVGLPRHYILLYIMQNDRSVYEYAGKLREETGLPVVAISRYGYRPSGVDYAVVDVGPEEFVGLFRDADYVCSNSYHGVIFSIVYNKKLCLKLCPRFSGRISSLARLLGFKLPDADGAPEIISFDVGVYGIIDAERQKAAAFLGEFLKCNCSALWDLQYRSGVRG